MAAKGALAKQEVTNKILEAFPGSFRYNDGKEIRINWVEDGIPLQIKVTLTAAKVMVEGGEDAILPGVGPATVKPTVTNEKVISEPTEDEKERLRTLMNRLGL